MHFWTWLIQTIHTESNIERETNTTNIMPYETHYQKKAREDREHKQHYCRSKENQPKKHPYGWTKENHYGMCGQNCPCCRKKCGDVLGVCPIC